MHRKFTQVMYLSDHFQYLLPLVEFPNKYDRKSEQLNKQRSIMSAHKKSGWWGGQEIDFKMEAYHD